MNNKLTVIFKRLSRLRQNTAILPYTAAKIQATRGEEVMETN